MKKNYVKPGIVIESFELTEHISASCGIVVADRTNTDLNICSARVTYLSKDICNAKDNKQVPGEIFPDSSPMKLFMKGNAACGNLESNPDKVCYTSGSDNPVFIS